MKWDDFFKPILESEKEDWRVIHQPLFMHSFEKITHYGDGKQDVSLDFKNHTQLFTLKSNISIAIAYGLTNDGNFQAPWANKFPDPYAFSQYADLLWNGTPVHRASIVVVDGGRVGLPIPKPNNTDVPRNYSRLASIIDKISSPTSDYGSYFQRAGFKVIEEPWPS